ncbi:urease accessory protein UreD [Labrys sp. KB_33_2]|uniref:urease accessory protein UreD n=1 Tax=Labrys sp. KB_33_2 TaxID=3237479 RepID=UPI003F927F87
MTQHWQPQALHLDPGLRTMAESRGRFELDFVRHGARTTLARQFVSYPFHLTRPFRLDPDIPSLLTLYQQSSSGGLYRGERLSCRFRVAAGAAAHITTQAATIVHDCQGQPARQNTAIRVESGGFLAYAPDPLVLFPGAFFAAGLEASLADDAVLFLCDAFSMHDPRAEGRCFDRLSSDVVIRDRGGRLAVRDCFQLVGDALRDRASPMGRWQVMASYLILGPSSRLPSQADLQSSHVEGGSIIGVSALPNAAGWGIRCLAADAIAARKASDRLFSLCCQAAFGHSPMPRRK